MMKLKRCPFCGAKPKKTIEGSPFDFAKMVGHDVKFRCGNSENGLKLYTMAGTLIFDQREGLIAIGYVDLGEQTSVRATIQGKKGQLVACILFCMVLVCLRRASLTPVVFTFFN